MIEYIGNDFLWVLFIVYLALHVGSSWHDLDGHGIVDGLQDLEGGLVQDAVAGRDTKLLPRSRLAHQSSNHGGHSITEKVNQLKLFKV